MNKQKKQFYKILSNYFNENTVEVEGIEDIEFLEKVAMLNMCLPIFMQGAKISGVKLNPALNSLLMQMVAQNYKNLTVQAKLINKLSENNISCAVLKGSTVSVLYPEPSLRPLGDIDLLVPLADYEKAIEVITGKKPDDKLSLMHDFHYSFDADGVEVEIHKAIDEFDEDEKNIEEFMSGALENAHISVFEQFQFPAFIDEYQIIMLLTHTKRHYFENQLNIRLLLDWAMFAKSVDDEHWNSTLYPLIKSFKLADFADALNCTCEDFLRLDLKNKIHKRFDKTVTEQLADEFISDRLNKQKIQTEDKAGKSFFDIFYMMSHTAKRDFKLARKCKILMPVFWLIIVVRYFYRMKIGLRGKLDYAKYSTDYKNKNKLFDEINK